MAWFAAGAPETWFGEHFATHDSRHSFGMLRIVRAGHIAMRHPIHRPIRLSDMTADELRARAVQYRTMAGTARTAAVRAALLRLAERFEALAAARQAASGAAEPPDV